MGHKHNKIHSQYPGLSHTHEMTVETVPLMRILLSYPGKSSRPNQKETRLRKKQLMVFQISLVWNSKQT